MDLSKLKTGQKVALVSGLVLLINMFIPWWFREGGGGLDAWDSVLAWLGSLLAIAAVVLIALKAFTSASVKLGTLQTEHLALLLAALGALLLIIKLIIGHEIQGYNISRHVGIFLGVIAGAGATWGSYLAMREAGLALPTAKDFTSLGKGSSS